MDCGTALATVGAARTDATTIMPVTAFGPTGPTAMPPHAIPNLSSTVPLTGIDPTAQIRIVEQTTTGPAVDWSPVPPPSAQVWTPAPTLAPQPVTTGSAPFIGDAVHGGPDDGWRSGAPPFEAIPYDAAALTIFAVLAIVLGLVAMFTKLVSYDLGDGIKRTFTIADVSTNAIPAMIAVAAVAVIGGGFAVARQRLGAGLAAGAGLALAGLVAIDIALVQSRIEALKLFVTADRPLTITREIPFFVLLAAGVCGLVVFLVSLPAARGDGRPRLNGAICAVGALATLAVAVGPFVPGGGTTWATNTDGGAFPSFVPWLRILALALVATAGIAGFTSQRRWGVGVAVAGLAAVVVQWFGTLSSPVTQGRTGVGIASIGTTDGTPSVLITVGIVVALIAAVTALLIDAAANRVR